jgi:hypothetical protein
MIREIAPAGVLLAFANCAIAADAPRGAPPLYAGYPTVAGDLEVGGGVFSSSGSHLRVFSTTGRVSAPLGPLNVEIQTTANTLLFSGTSSLNWMDAYAHGWHRTPNSAWGIFGGAEFAGATINSFGVEAKHYLGNVSIGADTAYLWTTYGHAWEASANADVFFTPNHRVGFAAQYFNGFTATNIWSLRVDAEARFASSPWSVWGWATHWNSSGTEAWAGLAGFRLYLDAPGSTLQSHGKDVPFYYQSIVPFL